jgi:hypothetical protein
LREVCSSGELLGLVVVIPAILWLTGSLGGPGKKHRQPMPKDPGARIADSQAAKMRTAKTMQKTNRRRGRG